MIDVEKELAKAVRHFWKTRSSQHRKQGSATGRKDAGSRGAVTGGKHADGFVDLIANIVRSAGVQDMSRLLVAVCTAPLFGNLLSIPLGAQAQNNATLRAE